MVYALMAGALTTSSTGSTGKKQAQKPDKVKCTISAAHCSALREAIV